MELEFEFDKFMDNIEEIEKSSKKRHEKVVEDTPQQRYQKRYQELHQNRIVWRNWK
jgi:glycine cleavage system protein P-like pyridoxal-binding family